MRNLFEHEYPYTNFHEMNLDWVIGKMKQLDAKVESIAAGAAAELVEKYVNHMLPNAMYDASDESIALYVDVEEV